MGSFTIGKIGKTAFTMELLTVGNTLKSFLIRIILVSGLP